MLLCDREEYKNANNKAETNHNREDYSSPPTNHKDDRDSVTSSALQQLPSEILPHPLQKKSAKFFFDNYSTVKVKRQKVWLSVRGNLEMSYCPTLQLLQRETWGPFLESTLKF